MLLNANVFDTKENPEPKVLVVDGDRTCLTILGRILQICSFKVTKCDKAREALTTLETSQNQFDMVITDLQVPDMDGFDLLTNITSLKMNVPVIVTSSYDNEDVLKNARRHGASGYLVKPIRIEYIRQVWTYVYEVCERHRINNKRSIKGGGSNSEENSNPNYKDTWIIAGITATTNNNNIQLGVDNDYSRSNKGEGNKCIMKKRKAYHPQENNNSQESTNMKNMNKDGDVNAQVTDPYAGTNSVITQPARKKQRVIWTPELHDKFVAAVNQFGTSKAVPKKILEFMNIPGLTRENVASHLQKYRQYHKKQERSLQEKSDGNLMKLASSKEHKCSKRISQTKVRNQAVTNPAFSAAHACKTAQPLKIEADTRQEMAIPKGKTEMPMALGEVVNEGNIVTSYPYSTMDSRFRLFETPNPYWGIEFPYDENSVHSELASMTTVAQPYGYGELSHDENSVHNEPMIASMPSFGQPYQFGEMLSHDENSVHNESEIALMNVVTQTCGYGDTSFGTDIYGNDIDLSYCDPYATPILYGEPFNQNNEHIITHFQQQGFGHNMGF